eukprot:3497266-Prymnesium_polylepis.1
MQATARTTEHAAMKATTAAREGGAGRMGNMRTSTRASGGKSPSAKPELRASAFCDAATASGDATTGSGGNAPPSEAERAAS